jgi:hypothetical protein
MSNSREMTLLCNNKPVGRVQFVRHQVNDPESQLSKSGSRPGSWERIRFGVDVAIMNFSNKHYQIKTDTEVFLLSRIVEISVNDDAIVYEADVRISAFGK